MIQDGRLFDALGYPRPDHEDCVLKVKPIAFAQRASETLLGQPHSPLGSLDLLPVEIVQQIFEHLDVATFLSARLLNRLTCGLVENAPKFRALKKHALATLRAVVRSRLTCYTISDVYGVLTQSECDMCSAFGSFLHLPSCRRCCFSCVRDQLDLVPSVPTMSDQLNELDLVDFAKAQIPGMRSLPGHYSMCHHPGHCMADKGGFTLLYKPQMRNKNARLDSYLAAMDARDGRVEIQKKIDRRVRAAANTLGLDGAPGKDAAVLPFNTIRTLMSVTPMPFLDTATGSTECGLSCKGCFAVAAATNRSLGTRIDQLFASNSVYSRKELRDHVERCAGAQLLREKWSDADSFPSPVPQRVGIQFQRELWSLTCFNLAPAGSVAIADYS